MEAQLDIAVKRAKKYGYTIAICHMRPDTISFLADLDIKALREQGVQFVTLPQVEKMRQVIIEEAEHEK